MIIKRVKVEKDRDGKPLGGPATHYVKKLADKPRGSVQALTADRAQALDASPDQWEAVKAFYKDRPAAGTFSAEPTEVKPKAAPGG